MDIQWLLHILFAVVLIKVVLIYVFLKYSHTYWKRKGVAFIKPTIPFGVPYDLVNKNISMGEHGALMYNKIKAMSKYFGGYYTLSFPVLVPVDPELIKHILVKDFQYFNGRGFYFNEEVDPLSAHLVSLSGEKWKKLRTKLSPTFTSGKIKTMIDTLMACSEELDNILDNSVKYKEPIDIQDIMYRWTTDNISSCAFGLTCSSLKDPDTEFRKYGKLFIETTFSDRGWQVLAVYYPWILKFFKIPIINRKVSKFFMDTIKYTVDYREKNQIHRKDFLDLYIKLKNNTLKDDDGNLTNHNEKFTFNELAAQAFAFYTGGFDTTGASMTFCLLELSLNQYIQSKLRNEIIQILNNEQISYETISKMTYMDQVIQEVLRKYPAIPMINRTCNQAYRIPNSNVTLDKGVTCWISVLGLHRDPEYYPKPDLFDPKRFSEEEKSKRIPFTYLPFGEGPRICIGMRFALFQMKIGLTKLLKKYQFTLNSKTKLPIGLSTEGVFLSPKNKIWLDVTKLDL